MKYCKIKGCDRIHDSKGFCKWHYDHLPENKEKARIRSQQPHRKQQRKEANAIPERKAYRKNWQLIKDYSISLHDYQNLLLSQNECCDICKCVLIKPHVDHDHQTGKVRGLLCRPCNQGIGFLKEDIALLNNAIEYLEKHKN